MIVLDGQRDQGHIVLGLGRSGLAAVRALGAGGARILAWDDAAERRAAVAALPGVTVADPVTADLAGFGRLVLSPGIPRRHPRPHPAVARAAAAGLAIVNDIDLLAEALPAARYLGITGTNGKSTTTALIGHVLRASGQQVAVGGNLGTPALDLPPLGPGGWYVLELSSYQLETVAAASWSVAVLLNITPDHLDRYAGMADYIAAKRRLFDHQPAGATAVIGLDDAHSRAIAAMLAARGDRRVIGISGGRAVAGGVYAEEGWLTDALSGTARRVLDLRRAATLPGAHNWQNAAAAYAAGRAAGLDGETIAKALLDFPGLEHRQQLVAARGRLRFVNDSKATNADAAAKALASYPRIYWIAGGRPKPGGYAVLEPFLGGVVHAFLIGEATEALAGFLDGRRPYTRCRDLAEATRAAGAMAANDGAAEPAVILLSPACASFDQFADYEDRGRRFAALARELAAAPAGGQAA